MANTSTYPLRLPTSLKDQVAKVAIVAKRDNTSMNQFIAIAVAEKISALDTEQFFAKRAKRIDIDEFKISFFALEVKNHVRVMSWSNKYSDLSRRLSEN